MKGRGRVNWARAGANGSVTAAMGVFWSYLQDIKANVSVLVHIGVETRRGERHRWRCEWIVCAELQLQFVRVLVVWSASRAFNGAHPLEQIVAIWKCTGICLSCHLQSDCELLLGVMSMF